MHACAALKSLSDRTIVITGATDGIGLECARQLLDRGARHIVVHARSRARGAPVVDALREQFPDAALDLVSGDLSSLADVVRLAHECLDRFAAIDALVNNAGVGAAAPHVTTEDGHDLTFQVNYLAPYLLTEHLRERLAACAPARIVNVSSAGYALGSGIHFDDLDLERGAYAENERYCQSKLAMVMWTLDLAEELRERGVTCNALHPSTYVDTKLVRQRGGTPLIGLAEGTTPVVRLVADADVEGVTGAYFDRYAQRNVIPEARDPALRGRLRQVTRAMLAGFLPGDGA